MIDCIHMTDKMLCVHCTTSLSDDKRKSNENIIELLKALDREGGWELMAEEFEYQKSEITRLQGEVETQKQAVLMVDQASKLTEASLKSRIAVLEGALKKIANNVKTQHYGGHALTEIAQEALTSSDTSKPAGEMEISDTSTMFNKNIVLKGEANGE